MNFLNKWITKFNLPTTKLTQYFNLHNTNGLHYRYEIFTVDSQDNELYFETK